MKTKLQNKFSQILKTSISIKTHSEICEQIADDYAIDFANWLNNNVLTPSGNYYRLLGNLKVSELLLIYKKEKNLL